MNTHLAKFLHELGQLKRVRRSGWWVAGIRDPESVADHSFRTAALAYVLAILEGADAGEAMAMAVFHDLAETRMNDIHRLGKKYVDWKEVEERVTGDQLSALPAELGERIRALLEAYRRGSSLEARVARDADRLECLLQAREYAALGAPTEEWIESNRKDLSTESARELAREGLRGDPRDWWGEGRRSEGP